MTAGDNANLQRLAERVPAAAQQILVWLHTEDAVRRSDLYGAFRGNNELWHALPDCERTLIDERLVSPGGDEADPTLRLSLSGKELAEYLKARRPG